MSHKVTVEEHPLPAVVLHWVHLISFLILAFTGLAIHYKPSGWPMGSIVNLHYLNMFVFVCTHDHPHLLGVHGRRFGEHRLHRADPRLQALRDQPQDAVARSGPT